ncbi:MAG: YraN family protein [Clostridiales bacterium]|nr:YraN family protein [Clostridiales bacterium]
MEHNNTVGAAGESFAAQYLRERGYKILERNHHEKTGEIDIIAQKDGFIVFAEVKTRKQNSMCSGLEAVNLNKQKKIIKTALMYIVKNKITVQPRFDVIEIYTGTQDEFSVNHIQNAFALESDDLF